MDENAVIVPIDGPLAGIEKYATRQPILRVPMMLSSRQAAEARPWVGVVMAFGEIRYERGVYQGAFAEVWCCPEMVDHQGLRHPPWIGEIRVSDPVVQRPGEPWRDYQERARAAGYA